MKRILNRLNKQGYKKDFILFFTFIIISTITWFAGKHIKFGHHAPLHSAKRRIFFIVLLGVAFILRSYFLRRKRYRVPPAVNKPNATPVFPLLNSRWQKIISFVKNLSSNHDSKIKLSDLPWFLLIGPAGSGKTALMSNSQISYIPKQRAAPESLDEIQAHGACDWWLTQDAVLFDVPSNYLTASANTQWQTIFDKKWRGQNKVSGVIVTLPLSDLTDLNTRDRFVENLKFRISELKTKFGASLPFYFLLTKCDLLPGFLDFFAHSGTDELGQAWGITLPAHTSIVDTFINRFNALIKRLNKQLIWRLHQERGAFERVFIKDFPLQIERLKEMMIDVLHHLTKGGNTFSLQGVYLTSAVQQSAPEMLNSQQRTIEASTAAALQIMHVPAMPSRSYFIRQFLLQGLASHYGQPLKIWQQRPVIYGVCASMITVTIAFLGYDIFYSQEKMLAKQDVVVSSFNIIVPQEKPQETQIGDSLTIVS